MPGATAAAEWIQRGVKILKNCDRMDALRCSGAMPTGCASDFVAHVRHGWCSCETSRRIIMKHSWKTSVAVLVAVFASGVRQCA